MGFSIEHDGCLVLFKFNKSFDEKDFTEFLAILDRLLDRKKPFCFILDANDTKNAPLRAGVTLIKWMKVNRPRIKAEGNLKASAVVMNYPKFVALLNWAFKKQKPVSPNLVCTNIDAAHEFIKHYKPDDDDEF